MQHYPRVDDEGRKLIVAALGSKANIEILNNQELRIRLAPQSAPHKDKVISILCEKLNKMDKCFPGTNLKLHYSIAGNYR